MDRRAFLAAVAAGAVGGLAGCVGSRSAAERDFDVGMSSADFRPQTVEVVAGETVVWDNTSNRTHTVTAYEDGIPEGTDFFASGGFDSETAAREGWQSGFEGSIRPGDRYERRFEVPGEYRYFCVPHEPGGMVGTVVVTE